MKLTIRDLFWALLVVALAVSLWLQGRRCQEAVQEAKNREIENDYLVKKVLKLESDLYGTTDSPKPKQ
jgi:hypothetical protein